MSRHAQQSGWVLAVVLIGVVGLSGCGTSAHPSGLPDPCELVSPEVLVQLGVAGEVRAGTHQVDGRWTRSCSIAGEAAELPALLVEVSSGASLGSTAWREEECYLLGDAPRDLGEGSQGCAPLIAREERAPMLMGLLWPEPGLQARVEYRPRRDQQRSERAEEAARKLLTEAAALSTNGVESIRAGGGL